MARSALTNNHRTTLPESIRVYLNIQKGEKIEFIINDVGQVLLRPRREKFDIDDIFKKFEKTFDDYSK